MTGPFPPQQPDPAQYGPPSGTQPQFPQPQAQFPPQSPAQFGPQDPAQFGPQGPAQDPAQFRPQDPAQFRPQDPAQFPQHPGQFGPQFPAQFGVRPGRPPRDKMVIALIAIIATLLVLCLAMAVGSVYFLREEPGDDDQTSEIFVHHPFTGG